MPAILKLSRRGVGVELRRGTFEIELDGKPVGTITWHQEAEIPIEPGRHSVQLRAGRLASRSQVFEAREGSVVSFRCHGAMVWPRYVASLLKPDLAISLKRE